MRGWPRSPSCAAVGGDRSGGWAAYYRGVVSSRLFRWLDSYLWKLSISGPGGATATSRSAGSSAGTSASSISSGMTTGCSATVTPALTWSSSPGRPSNGTCRSRARHPPMTLPWPATGPGGARSSSPRWTGTPCGCSPRSTGCVLCADYLLSAGQPPQSPWQWEQWWLHVTRKAVAASYLTHHGRPGMPDDDQTRLVHASCQRALQARQRRKPDSFTRDALAACWSHVRGLTRTHGSEEAGTRQHVPLSDRSSPAAGGV